MIAHLKTIGVLLAVAALIATAAFWPLVVLLPLASAAVVLLYRLAYLVINDC